MSSTKVYHIYAKDKCLYHSIMEEDFKIKWEEIKMMVGLMKTDYSVEDLSYEECEVNRVSAIDSSH